MTSHTASHRQMIRASRRTGVIRRIRHLNWQEAACRRRPRPKVCSVSMSRMQGFTFEDYGLLLPDVDARLPGSAGVEDAHRTFAE